MLLLSWVNINFIVKKVGYAKQTVLGLAIVPPALEKNLLFPRTHGNPSSWLPVSNMALHRTRGHVLRPIWLGLTLYPVDQVASVDQHGVTSGLSAQEPIF